MKINNSYFEEKNEYDISVIVVTYNFELDKCLFTLESILQQININFEIIVADDGSENNYFTEIESFFQNRSFNYYKLLSHEKNQGTVYNYMDALRVASGKAVKSISPGDTLLGKDTLKRWHQHFVESKNLWSFCDAIFYKSIHGKMEIISQPAHPDNVKPYLLKQKDRCRWNFLIRNDRILGANMLCDRDTLITYMELVLGKVKYAEDCVYRIMMFDGIMPYYFPENCILYEFGDGISTSSDLFWKEMLTKDFESEHGIICSREIKDKLQKRIIGTWYSHDLVYRVIRLIEKFRKIVIKNRPKRMSSTDLLMGDIRCK